MRFVLSLIICVLLAILSPSQGEEKDQVGTPCNTALDCRNTQTALVCLYGQCRCPEQRRLGKASTPLNTTFSREVGRCVAIPGSACYTSKQTESWYTIDCEPRVECLKFEDDPDFGVCAGASKSVNTAFATGGIIFATILTAYAFSS